jgi:hypothetical protein
MLLPQVTDDAGLYVGTALETTTVATDRGYIWYGTDLQPKGLYWTLGAIEESAVSVFLRKRFINYDLRTVAVLSPSDPPDQIYTFSLIGDVDFTVAARVEEPSNVFTVNFTTQIQGWANRNFVTRYPFGGIQTVTTGTPGFFNFLYASEDANASMLCASVSLNGLVSSHAAFPLSQAGWNFGEEHEVYTNVSTGGTGLTYWTYIENYTFNLPAPTQIFPRIINWRRSFWGQAASAWLSYGVPEFSDPDDQEAYAAHLADRAVPYKVAVLGNQTVFWLTIPGSNPDTLDKPFKVLVVDREWETYESFILEGSTFASPLGQNPFYIGWYYRDPEGRHYGLDIGGERMWRLSSGGDPVPDPAPNPEPNASAGNPVLRSWGFTLDNHEFYVNRLGAQMTLVYDLASQQWSRWTTRDQSKWRAHQGFNWLGMSQDNYAGGATSNIVAGDDTDGILWTLDPNSGLDDTTSDPPTQQEFPRRVLGGVPARSRQAARNSLVAATINVGEPVGTTLGSTMELETSDDYGKTWVSRGQVAVSPGETYQQIRWRSLGVMRAPGRLFRFTDWGATARIDGVDVTVEAGDGQ